jgi:hypothetical protein
LLHKIDKYSRNSKKGLSKEGTSTVMPYQERNGWLKTREQKKVRRTSLHNR